MFMNCYQWQIVFVTFPHCKNTEEHMFLTTTPHPWSFSQTKKQKIDLRNDLEKAVQKD